MNTQWLKTITTGIFAIGMIIPGCTPTTTQGPGSETVAVAGRIVDSLGQPVPQTQVRLLRADYNPITDTAIADSMLGVTDQAGYYAVNAPGKGAYSLEAANSNSKCKALITGVNIDKKDSVFIPDAVLRTPGALRIVLNDTANEASGYVYLPGTTCFAQIRGGIAQIEEIPAGLIPAVRYLNTAAASMNRVIKTDLTIVPEDTLVVMDMVQWKYSTKLRLNTTMAGADVGRNVYDFPVLVRFTTANFDFNTAKNDGADVRFTKSNGTPLPHEIERWDAASGLAEVWVKVDTVYGNDSTQYVMLYWGASTPSTSSGISGAAESGGTAVFDTSEGFAGVWHLGENGDTSYDAAGYAFNGMNSGTASATGIIGNARGFVNGNFIKIPGLLGSPANVTLSAWVASDTSGWGKNNTWGQSIVSIGDYALFRLDDILGIGTSGWYLNRSIGIGPDTSFISAKSGQSLANTGWHFVAYSINSTAHEQVLYIDGVQCAITTDVNPICYTGLGTDTYIGIHGNNKKNCNFSGRIDEVRVSKKALSQDWIKLCYMNQKGQDALVKW